MSKTKHPQKRRKKQPPDKGQELLPTETGNNIANNLTLSHWDYIIAGDGSATTWEHPAGFGSILYCREDGSEKKFFGGFSQGTNNIAELMAVALPLMYLCEKYRGNPPPLTVYVISDSTYVVNGGNGESRQKANQPLWALIASAKSRLNLKFIHINRMLLSANVFGDTIGNHIRKQFITLSQN